ARARHPSKGGGLVVMPGSGAQLTGRTALATTTGNTHSRWRGSCDHRGACAWWSQAASRPVTGHEHPWNTTGTCPRCGNMEGHDLGIAEQVPRDEDGTS